MTTSTSTMFDTWDWTLDLLQQLEFQTHPYANGPVMVHFGQPEDAELGQENVVLHSVIDSDAEQQWSTFGPGKKDERFAMLVTVTTAVPGLASDECRTRLREMTSAVEAELRTVRRPTVDNVLWWAVSAFRPEIVPTEHGFRGRCRIVIAVRAYF